MVSSQDRFYAMLTNGNELDGLRLLSEERVRTFHIPSTQRLRSGAAHAITEPSRASTSPEVPAWGPWGATRFRSATMALAGRRAGRIPGTVWQSRSTTVAWSSRPPGECPLTPISADALGIPDQILWDPESERDTVQVHLFCSRAYPSDLGLIGVGIARTSGSTFSANSLRLFSALSLGIPP